MGVSVVSVVPTPSLRKGLVRAFLRRAAPHESVFVTSFVDDALPVLHALCDAEEGFADVEAVPFPSLVARIRETIGGPALHVASGSLLRRTVRDAAGDLPGDSALAAVCRSDEAIRRVVATLGELHAAGWDADRLAGIDAEGYLGDWIRDLGRLDAEIGRRLLVRGRIRHHEQLRTGDLEPLSLDHAFPKLLVFSDGEAHPGRWAFLRWLAERNVEVTLVTECHAAGIPIFAASRRAADFFGVPLRESGMAENEPGARLFTDGPRLGLDAEERVATTVASEAEWALRCAKEDGGTILARNLDRYAAPLMIASRRLGIPVTVACNVELSAAGLANGILRLLRLAARPDAEEWRRTVRSGVLGLTPADRHRALRWAESGETPETLGERIEDEAARTRLAALVDFLRHVDDASWEVWNDRLHRLVADVLHPAAPPENDAATREAHVGSAVQREICAALSFTEEEERVPLSAFSALVHEALGGARATIPTVEGGVRVVCEPAAVGDTEILHVLGATDGTYPRPRREDPLLPDEARTLLNARRGELAALPLAAEVAEDERGLFYRTAVAARRLVFWRPARDGESSALPSVYVGMATATPRAVSEAREPWPEIPHREDLYARPADTAFRDAWDADPEARRDIGLDGPIGREKVALPEGAITWPMLRDAAECDLRYAFRHRLGVRVDTGRDRFTWRSAVPALAESPSDDLVVLRTVAEDAIRRAVRTGTASSRAIADLHAAALVDGLVRRESGARRRWPRTSLGTPRFGEGVLKAAVRGLALEGPFLPISRTASGHWILHLPAAIDGPKGLHDGDLLAVATASATLRRKHGERLLVEIETGRRNRFLMDFHAGPVFSQFANEGLKTGTFDLSSGDDPEREFVRPWAEIFARIEEVVRRGRAVPRPGRGCAICDLGEICRRHRGHSDVADEEMA